MAEDFYSETRIDGGPKAPGALLEDTGFMLEQDAQAEVDSYPAVISIGMADGSRFQMDAKGDAVNTAAAGIGNGRDARIVELDLSQTELSDAGLGALGTLPNLHVLKLADTHVTDAGLSRFARSGGMRAVTELSLHSTGISDAGVRSIARLPNLDRLNLEDTAITNAVVRDLRDSRISVLNLGQTAINDEGLKYLKDMPNLKVLSLEGDHITEDGLKHLAKCRGLQVLNLTDTKLTNHDVDKLQRKMPSTLIVRPDGTYGNEGAHARPPVESPGLLRRLVLPIFPQ